MRRRNRQEIGRRVYAERMPKPRPLKIGTFPTFNATIFRTPSNEEAPKSSRIECRQNAEFSAILAAKATKTKRQQKMETLLTIAEASRLTGKHRDTIRKWAKEHPQAVKTTENGKRKLIAEMLTLDYQTEAQPAQKVEVKEAEGEAIAAELELLKKQNAELLAANSALTEKNDKLTEKITEFADALIKLTDQQQQLTAQFNQHLLAAQVEEEKPRKFGIFKRKK